MHQQNFICTQYLTRNHNLEYTFIWKGKMRLKDIYVHFSSAKSYLRYRFSLFKYLFNDDAMAKQHSDFAPWKSILGTHT